MSPYIYGTLNKEISPACPVSCIFFFPFLKVMLFPFYFLLPHSSCITDDMRHMRRPLYLIGFCGLLSLLLNCYYRGNRDARSQLQVTRLSMSFSLFARPRRNKEEKQNKKKTPNRVIHQKSKEPYRYNKSRRECDHRK